MTLQAISYINYVFQGIKLEKKVITQLRKLSQPTNLNNREVFKVTSAQMYMFYISIPFC